MRAPNLRKRGSGGRGEQPDRRSPARDEADVFISEVNEELQRERLTKLAWRYGPFVLGAIILVVVIVAGNEIYQSSKRASAQEAGEQLIAASRSDAPAASYAAIADDLGDAGVVASLAASAYYAGGAPEDDDSARAEALYGQIASSDAPPRYRDLAMLRQAMLTLETADPDDLIALLAPATEAGRPYRPLALEISAAAHMRAGDIAAAREALMAARDGAETQESARARLSDQIEALDEFALQSRPDPATPAAPSASGDAAAPSEEDGAAASEDDS